MSDENVPKLRLKPKLGTEPAVAPQAAVSPVETVPSPTSATEAEAPKLVRLKPKLMAAPVQEAAAVPASESPPAETTPMPERPKPRLSAPPIEKAATRPPMAMPAPVTVPEATPAPAVETPKPAFKLGLRPAAAVAAQPAAPTAVSANTTGPTPPAASESPTLEAPPPPKPVETDRGEKGEPAEIIAMRKASAMPFPPPPGAVSGKFPPPPGQKKSKTAPAQPGSKPPIPKATGSKKKLFIMAGAGIFVLALAGGGFVAWQKFTEPPPEPPRKPKVVAKPPVAALVEQAKGQAEAPLNEVLATETKPVEPAVAATVTPEPIPAEEVKPVEPPKPVAPPPPPPPSVAFRGWVENLKISGVRGGATPRVFVGKSSYQPGDLINPQLGITFEGYNAETRMLMFKDKTGAKVERRN